MTGKKWRILRIAAYTVCSILFVFVFVGLSPLGKIDLVSRNNKHREPTWGKKTFRQWASQLEHGDNAGRLAAAQTLHAMLAWPLPGAMCCQLPKQPQDHLDVAHLPEILPAFIAGLRDPNVKIRTEIVQSLACCGPFAQPALPKLIAQLVDDRVAEDVLLALAAIGEPAAAAMPDVLPRLTDKNPQIRFAAAQAAWMIDQTPAAITTCGDLLMNFEVGNVFEFMAREMGPQSGRALPKIIEFLEVALATKGSNQYCLPMVHCLALLVAIGPEAEPAMPQLLRVFNKDYDLRERCARAFQAIGPGAKDATPELLKWLRSLTATADTQPLKGQTVRLRMAAIRALGGIGSAAAEAVPDLIQALDDKEALVTLPTIEALGRIGPPAKSAIKRLAHSGCRFPSILVALWRISGDPTYVEELIERAHNKSLGDQQHLEAFIALVSIGQSDEGAAEVLDGMIRQRRDWLDIPAAEILGRMTKSPLAMDWLTQQLERHDGKNVSAAAALWRMTQKSEYKTLIRKAMYQSKLRGDAEWSWQTLDIDFANPRWTIMWDWL